MAVLARFDGQGLWQDTWVCDDWITRKLAALGVVWGRWPLHAVADASAAAARAAYAHEIAGLQHLCHVRSAEWLSDDAASHDSRQPWLAEHRLPAAEIRFFLAGAGLFYLRDGDGHLGLLCDAGEWLVLPAELPHVFDVGTAQDLQVLRLSAGTGGARVLPTGHTAAPPLAFEAFVAQVLELTGDVDG